MAYSSLPAFRSLTHFTESEIPDSEVSALIPEADRAILRLATIEVYDEQLTGDIDGVNKLFMTKHKPIADTDFDSDVDSSDVSVWLVDYDSEQNPVHTSVQASSVNARDGIITLASAPTTSNAEVGVFADYRYYKMPVDYDMLKLAANYYLAYLVEMKVRGDRTEKYPAEYPRSVLLLPDLKQKSRWLELALQHLPFARPSLKLT